MVKLTNKLDRAMAAIAISNYQRVYIHIYIYTYQTSTIQCLGNSIRSSNWLPIVQNGKMFRKSPGYQPDRIHRIALGFSHTGKESLPKTHHKMMLELQISLQKGNAIDGYPKKYPSQRVERYETMKMRLIGSKSFIP